MDPDRPSIIGASDAMVSLPLLLATPPSTKCVSVYGSTAIMYAGSLALHGEIMDTMIPVLGSQPELPTAEIAALYAATYRELRSQHAAAAVLGNYGLDLPTFLARKRSIREEIASHLAARLDEYQFPENEDVEVIVAGIDATGPHIWTVTGGKPSNAAIQGYAAIGIGAEHAVSFLMRVAYDPRLPLPEALVMAFFAKRHGELAPYVGERTDLFTIGPGLHSHRDRGNDVTDALAKLYEEWRRAEREGLEKARGAMNEMYNRYAAQGRSL